MKKTETFYCVGCKKRVRVSRDDVKVVQTNGRLRLVSTDSKGHALGRFVTREYLEEEGYKIPRMKKSPKKKTPKKKSKSRGEEMFYCVACRDFVEAVSYKEERDKRGRLRLKGKDEEGHKLYKYISEE